MGPFMFLTVIQMRKWKDKIVNTPSNIFYPVPDSYLVPTIYDGSFELPEEVSFCPNCRKVVQNLDFSKTTFVDVDPDFYV